MSHQTTSANWQAKWLPTARIAWFILFTLAMVSMLYYLFQMPTLASENIQLTEQSLVSMDAGLAIRLAAYLALPIYRPVIVSLVYLLVSGWLFRLRSNDLMALYASLMFGMLGIIPLAGNLIVADGLNLIQLNRLWLFIASTDLSLAMLIILSFLLVFPDARFVPLWSKWLILLIVPIALSYGVSFVLTGNIYLPVFLGGVAPVIILSITLQNYRYKQVATPSQKQQIKWVIIGAGAMIFAQIAGTIPFTIAESLERYSPAYFWLKAVAEISFLIGYIVLMVTFLFSIIRYRLWNIDFVINRSLVYGGLTLLLGGVFAGIFYGSQSVLESFLGSEQRIISAGISGIAITLLFNPTRQRVRRFVDRRFYGIEIDYLHSAISSSSVRQSSPEKPATSIGRFGKLEFIGEGGMGEVYRAMHPTLDQWVALKIMSTKHADDQLARKRFRREGKVMVGLKHPNIVQALDFGEDADSIYIVMEFVEGIDLSSHLSEFGSLSFDLSLNILHDIASALDYAHGQGIIHRDIKPGNVMLETIDPGNLHYRAKLMDFGIARQSNSQTQITQAGMVGTLDYVSPEQIKGEESIDGRTDVYSLGVMAYQMFTGQLPFMQQNTGALVMAHLIEPAPDPRKLLPDLPANVAGGIMRAMAKKPKERFGSAGEMLAALD